MDSPLSAKAALLAALINGKGFGLELIARVDAATKGHVQLNEGSVYPALRAMERDGLVRSFEADPLPERGGRPRRYYELTAKGIRQARAQGEALAPLFGITVPT
jgi:PadR family transcriptional regulator PadR